jgi:hypothetical protein
VVSASATSAFGAAATGTGTSSTTNAAMRTAVPVWGAIAVGAAMYVI